MRILRVFPSIIWLALTGTACASGEGGIAARIESVVIDASEAGYRFSVKMDKDDTLELIDVEWAGKKFSFNKKDFGQIGHVFIRGIKMVAPTEFSTGKQDSVIVVLPYNKERMESADGKSTHYQIDVVRLHFHKGELTIWEKAEAIEGKPGKWKLTNKGEITSHVKDGVERVDADGVHDNGEHSGTENPYARITVYEDSH